MSEPILTYLMPIYATLSWYLLYTQSHTGRHLLPISLIGWLWAGVNILRSKRLDLGIVTFGVVLLASAWERYTASSSTNTSNAPPTSSVSRMNQLCLTIGCLMVAANFSLVILFWKAISKDLGKSKSLLWMMIFWSYCACMMVFWVVAAYRNQMMRGENNDGLSSYSAV